MAYCCVMKIRRWADADIENVGRDVLRRQAHALADECESYIEALIEENKRKMESMAGTLAETAARNERNEKQVISALSNLREQLDVALDSRNKWSKMLAENAQLRARVKELESGKE